jgi:hypothetical protein
VTAVPGIDPARFLYDELAQASPDLMRDLLTTFVNVLLSAQADAVCGAEYGTRSFDRVNRRNGYRHRDLAPPSTSCREVPHPGLHPPPARWTPARTRSSRRTRWC